MCRDAINRVLFAMITTGGGRDQSRPYTFSSIIYSISSIFTLFLIRLLESLERNTFFSSWILTIMDNYWTRLVYFNNDKTIDQDLKDAIGDVTKELESLSD